MASTGKTQINIVTDPKLREEFFQAARRNGIDMTTALTDYMRQYVSGAAPNTEEERMVAALRKLLRKKKPTVLEQAEIAHIKIALDSLGK